MRLKAVRYGWDPEAAAGRYERRAWWDGGYWNGWARLWVGGEELERLEKEWLTTSWDGEKWEPPAESVAETTEMFAGFRSAGVGVSGVTYYPLIGLCPNLHPEDEEWGEAA